MTTNKMRGLKQIFDQNQSRKTTFDRNTYADKLNSVSWIDYGTLFLNTFQINNWLHCFIQHFLQRCTIYISLRTSVCFSRIGIEIIRNVEKYSQTFLRVHLTKSEFQRTSPTIFQTFKFSLLQNVYGTILRLPGEFVFFNEYGSKPSYQQSYKRTAFS